MNTIFSKSECLEHYTWGDDCHGWIFVDTDALSVKQELMPPDTAEKLHYHEQATQFFYIMNGRAKFTVDGEVIELREQQAIQIDPMQQHSIANHQHTDLEFLVYSYPSTKNDRIEIK
ncbi:cupin domain-containing protein [Mucilaginibacter sp. dw_454]|uniref:cupin domain-containing protein n=1 Tax=Mucilaginibacter sp. dw_454 TaxID=2720079 RepID=UPI001BD33B7C|nr:cupin domain-containing protein [Mucilaginibacter sp. dw_454]